MSQPSTSCHGGARKGAGRKRNVLPVKVLQRVGSPPTTKPLELARWYSALLSELVHLFVTTGKYVEMLREVKGAAGAMGRVMPMDVLLAWRRSRGSAADRSRAPRSDEGAGY
jgi:hypothetical protein